MALKFISIIDTISEIKIVTVGALRIQHPQTIMPENIMTWMISEHFIKNQNKSSTEEKDVSRSQNSFFFNLVK